MYLTVCPPRGPGHDSSVGEWMTLPVCPPCGPGSIPSHGGVFQGIFLWLIILCQPVLSQRGRKWHNLPSTTPHNLWTARRKAEVGQIMVEKCILDVDWAIDWLTNLLSMFSSSDQMLSDGWSLPVCSSSNSPMYCSSGKLVLLDLKQSEHHAVWYMYWPSYIATASWTWDYLEG